MEKIFFGTDDNDCAVHLYNIENQLASLTVMDRGATVVSFKVFGRDIVGGYDDLESYIKDNSHQGGTIGRVANRIANARFTMDGEEYFLPKNDNGNCLHGGRGFDLRIWDVKEIQDNKIVFSYISEDGEEGFPGRLDTEVTYTLDGTSLVIDYKAIPHSKTPVSLTNHTYFNLDGLGGNVDEHRIRIAADKYVEVDDMLIPTGNVPSVHSTPFDFNEPHTIGERLSDSFIGYDHYFMFSTEESEEMFGKNLSFVAEMWGKDMKMSVYTDQPGAQFYTGNFLGNGPMFKGGVKQVLHGAFCFETHTAPNGVNHGVGFYEKGEVYSQTTVYRIEKI